jgi:photosystem II stability/assembly factor-like uncharacterized protein
MELSEIASTLEWRCIGPHRGGRVVAVAGHPDAKMVFFFGASAGGVWKTTDGGQSWFNVSDGYFNTASIGALAVSDSDPNVVYAGTGESCIRGNVSHGDGVYRSTNGGLTWTHMGLEDTRHIAKIRVHPGDPNLVYVAALGHAFGQNEQRGVFRSKDGGATWQHVLFATNRAGACDLAVDGANPRILYAGIWQAIRRPWGFESGGPDGGLFRSEDGGDTWERLGEPEGLPAGITGRIGVSASAGGTGRVWALIEAKENGLYRSDDYGRNWIRLNTDANFSQRPWYFHHIAADPVDADTMYVLNVEAWRSTDGGEHFELLATPHFDNHDLWIDPRDSKRMIEGNDGGACVTFNGGESWSSLYNQPTAQLYQVMTDTRTPYRVYGCQQDSTSISLPSRSQLGVITEQEWWEVGGGESGRVAVREDDPNVVYCGHTHGVLTRYDHRNGRVRDISIWPETPEGVSPAEIKYRFNWSFPLVLSPHDSGRLFAAGNVVFETTDEGQHWKQISPDLTRSAPHTLGPSGGPITRDNVSTDIYGSIFSFAEAPREPGLYWAGSDDGLVHVFRDGEWSRVTPAAMPEWSLISCIEPSHHSDGKAYICATCYKLDDTKPYVFLTEDYGLTWTAISTGLPAHDFIRVVREDLVTPGLLFAGGELGLYVSGDDGASWSAVRSNLPVVPIYDLSFRNGALIAATHGRSFWIADDLTLLRESIKRGRIAQVATGSLSSVEEGWVLPPQPAVRFLTRWGFEPRTLRHGRNYRMTGGGLNIGYDRSPLESDKTSYPDVGSNPPDGVGIWFHVANRDTDENVQIVIKDANARVVAAFATDSGVVADADRALRLSTHAGLNHFIWDLRFSSAAAVPGDLTSDKALSGPLVAPGKYSVDLRVGNVVKTESFDVLPDPLCSATVLEIESQVEMLVQIRDRIDELHRAVNQIRVTRTEIDGWVRLMDSSPSLDDIQLRSISTDLLAGLDDIEEHLYERSNRARADTMKYPVRLNGKLAFLRGSVSTGEGAPSIQAQEVFASLGRQADDQLERLRKLTTGSMTDFRAKLLSRGFTISGDSPGDVDV